MDATECEFVSVSVCLSLFKCLVAGVRISSNFHHSISNSRAFCVTHFKQALSVAAMCIAHCAIRRFFSIFFQLINSPS